MTVSELKEYIFDNNKIEYVLQQLGCHQIFFHPEKNYYSAAHYDGDNPNGIHIKNNKYLNYRSFSRHVSYDDGEDLISLIERTKQYSFKDAVKYLHDLFGLDYKWSKPSVKEKGNKTSKERGRLGKFNSDVHVVDVNDIPAIDEELLHDYISIPYIGWIREGIMPWTVKKFGLAYSYRRKRVIVPMRHWLTGQLLGITGRTVVENYDELGVKKYLITASYQKNSNLFGLYDNYDSIQKAGYVVVYESEKSVLKRDSKLDSTGVALSGHIISDEQVRILLGLNVDIVISLDNDVPLEEVRYICEKFYGCRHVFYTYDKWGVLGQKDSAADAPNKVFDILMKYKVRYDEYEHKKYIESLERKRHDYFK